MKFPQIFLSIVFLITCLPSTQAEIPFPKQTFLPPVPPDLVLATYHPMEKGDWKKAFIFQGIALDPRGFVIYHEPSKSLFVAATAEHQELILILITPDV